MTVGGCVEFSGDLEVVLPASLDLSSPFRLLNFKCSSGIFNFYFLGNELLV